MPRPDLDSLRRIKTFPSLVAYLRDDLDWPIESEDFDELTYNYEAEELGIDVKNAAKIEYIKQLKPLHSKQPWGIFFVKFEPKKLPVVALRRILGQLVIKKRASANKADQQTWKLNDLLFLSNYGENEQRQITFAHFSGKDDSKNLPTLKVLGWDGADTPLHVDHVHTTLKDKLLWPNDENDLDVWRKTWSSAFTLRHGQVIKTSKELAIKLAGLAQKIRKRANSILSIETESGTLRKLMSGFKEALIHDLTEDSFADMYAQTIAYGLLSARITNPKGDNPDELSSQMPITNPFLKELMESFLSVGGRKGKSGKGVGIDFDELGINEVVDLLDNSNMEAVVRDFGDKNPLEDPVIHFYELFLKEYDSQVRMERGVFYTPRPVVSFIVRSVDEILRTEFKLKDGLADTVTWGEMVKGNKDLEIPKGIKPDDQFVQILDPATGTGTFLVEVIDLIYKTLSGKWAEEGHSKKQIEQLWNDYVPKYLLPRLHGYELLMAPYAIAHMKVGLKLYETGYTFGSVERTRIYLTNTLEIAQDFSDRFAFAIPALAQEAKAVNEIKLDKKFTVIIGNPPYSPHNENRNPCVKNGEKTFIGELIDSYYYVDKIPINESNSKNIKADENKFIRYGEYKINTSGIGILGYVSASGYLDTPTMRAMRWNLLQSFKCISILNLHGNIRRKETSLDGSKDENVFDIQQGVAICLMRRLAKKTTIIKHADLWGSRHKQGLSNGKYEWLYSNSIYSILFNPIEPRFGQFLFAPTETGRLNEYENAFTPVNKIFKASNNGFKTHRDHFALALNEKEIKDRIDDLCNDSIEIEELRKKYELKDNRDWKLEKSRKALKANLNKQDKIRLCMYRPFDIRYCYYGEEVMDWPREETLQHLLDGKNVAFVIGRQGLAIPERPWEIIFATKYILDTNLYRRGGNMVFPLYLMPSSIETTMRPNLDFKFAEEFAKSAGLNYDSSLMNGRGNLAKTCGARDVFDFIYAVLHSLSYRTRYADFLKSDFPRLPLSNSVNLLRELVGLGGKLMALHLFDTSEAKILVQNKVQFVADGHAQVKKGFPKYENGKIMVNAYCHFENIAPSVWNFHIGGYQVCDKWLKDRGEKGGKNPRSGRVLTNEDINHYQKIIVAISETIRIMAEIDEVIEKHGGWPGAFVTE
jgi:predicted helicase